MFIEDDDLAVEEAASAIQTRCLGRKQSTACWLPELRPDVAADAGVVCAGTWDEAENELALWSVVLRSAVRDQCDAVAARATVSDSGLTLLRHEFHESGHGK